MSLPVKIKIVGNRKQLSVRRISLLARARADVRPYDIRVKRDHGGGLWTLEASDGQLYLAVLSRENTNHRRLLAEARLRDRPVLWSEPERSSD